MGNGRYLARQQPTYGNTASYISTVMPFTVALLYGASKAAVLSLTRGLAVDPARQQDWLRVFAV